MQSCVLLTVLNCSFQIIKKADKPHGYQLFLAPDVRLERTTLRLTAACSATCQGKHQELKEVLIREKNNLNNTPFFRDCIVTEKLTVTRIKFNTYLISTTNVDRLY